MGDLDSTPLVVAFVAGYGMGFIIEWLNGLVIDFRFRMARHDRG